MKKFLMPLVTLVLLLALAFPAMGASKAGVVFLDSQMIDSDQVVLNGLALREKFVFDVYVAGLYLAEKSHDADSILEKDAPRMMVMHFLRDVSAQKINAAWFDGLEANVKSISPELKDKFIELSKMMEDIKKGQTMTFTYSPATGTEIIVNDKSKGGIPGKNFADAILATWIGPKPGPGTSFKKELLGN